MEFSDLGEKKKDETHGNAADYVNTRISTGSVHAAMDLYAATSQTTEGNYEQLRLESKRCNDTNDCEENKRDTMLWKDQPKEIKCIIYTLSVMMVILYIIVTTVVVVMILPKDEPDGSWTQWSAWSNCDVTCDNGIQTRLRLCKNPSLSFEQLDCEGNSTDSRQCQKNPCPADGTWTQWSAWSNCDVTCDNGTQTRLRLCNNPFISTEQLDCKGNSTDSRQCQKNPCPDYGVAFTVYNPNTTGSSYTVIKFLSSFLNKGDAYNSTTGVFTCRVPGVYHFAITLTKRYEDISTTIAYMRINGYTNIYLYYYPTSDDSNEVGTYIMTGAGTYHLKINDTVFVYGVPNYFYSNTRSSFTGFLVSPDV